MQEPTTESEIKRAIVRDRDRGFTMLVGTYQPGIYSGARRLTHKHEDAEEVAQETFLRAYRALGQYNSERIRQLRVRPWLWTIALNLCRDRAGRPTIETGTLSEGVKATRDAPPFDSASWDRRLTELSEDQRTAVVLRHVADLPISDISEITGRPQGTIKTDVSRGLERLRRVLEREERL